MRLDESCCVCSGMRVNERQHGIQHARWCACREQCTCVHNPWCEDAMKPC